MFQTLPSGSQKAVLSREHMTPFMEVITSDSRLWVIYGVIIPPFILSRGPHLVECCHDLS